MASIKESRFAYDRKCDLCQDYVLEKSQRNQERGEGQCGAVYRGDYVFCGDCNKNHRLLGMPEEEFFRTIHGEFKTKTMPEKKPEEKKGPRLFEAGELDINTVPMLETPRRAFNAIVEIVNAKEALPNDQELGGYVRKIIDAYNFTT